MHRRHPRYISDDDAVCIYNLSRRRIYPRGQNYLPAVSLRGLHFLKCSPGRQKSGMLSMLCGHIVEDAAI